MREGNEIAILELPERCHAVLPGLPPGANVALCVRGESGVRLTALDLGPPDSASTLVRAFNRSLGIDVEQEKAMLAGCLFGWAPAWLGLPRPGEHVAPRLLH